MENQERLFAQRLRDKIVSLPFDLKVAFAMMADEDQPDQVRLLGAGTAIYVLGPNDIIPDHIMPVGYADDAIILWAMLDFVRREHPETAAKLGERFEGVFEASEETTRIFRAYLGELYDWMAGKLADLPRLPYKGKVAKDYVENQEAGEFLYDESREFVTEFDIDEEYLNNHLRGRLVLDALRQRAELEKRRPG